MNKNVILICGTVIFIFIGSFGYAIERMTHNTTTTVSLLTLLFTQLGLLVAALGTFLKTDKVKGLAENIHENTDRILNGDMEQKMVAVINRVVPGILQSHLGTQNTQLVTQVTDSVVEALGDQGTGDPTGGLLPESPSLSTASPKQASPEQSRLGGGSVGG